MRLPTASGCIRSWVSGDLASLVRHANNRRIWANLRDRFPHPYTATDGAAFLTHVQAMRPETTFAIDVDGEAVGGIGLKLQHDVERVSAEIGYWVGEAFWGRGLCAEALRTLTPYAMREHGLTRIFAVPFAFNVASCRVLEKAGYVLEGHMRRSAIKDGQILDQKLYAYVAE